MPCVDMNKYRRNRVIHLAQQQKEIQVLVFGTTISIRLCWTERFVITIQHSYERLADQTTRKSLRKDLIEKQWQKIQHFFSNEEKEMIINHMFINIFF